MHSDIWCLWQANDPRSVTPHYVLNKKGACHCDRLGLHFQTVDYKAMSRSLYFERYCDLAVQLQRVELLSLSREEKLAFFINVYNALVIHGNLRLGFPKNIWQRYRVREVEIWWLRSGNVKCYQCFSAFGLLFSSSSTMWATSLVVRYSHCRILKMECLEETAKVWHNSWSPFPGMTLDCRYPTLDSV